MTFEGMQGPVRATLQPSPGSLMREAKGLSQGTPSAFILPYQYQCSKQALLVYWLSGEPEKTLMNVSMQGGGSREETGSLSLRRSLTA